MRACSRTVFGAFVGLWMACVQAQTVRPGLWEVTTKFPDHPELERVRAEAVQRFKELPLEARRVIQEAMRERGVHTDDGMTSRVCISREMAERAELPVRSEAGCTSVIAGRTAKTMKVKFTCVDPPSSGEGVVTFQGPERYTMRLVTENGIDGQRQPFVIEAAGRWLSAECGGLKPLSTLPTGK
ncbi:MAG: DUF3617 domain-containing protein [Methylohalobius sp.]|nr:DUF3617 domain-containing protein [Methylohalobius sp.]